MTGIAIAMIYIILLPFIAQWTRGLIRRLKDEPSPQTIQRVIRAARWLIYQEECTQKDLEEFNSLAAKTAKDPNHRWKSISDRKAFAHQVLRNYGEENQ